MESEKIKEEGVSIKINYQVPEDIESHFSDSFVVQHQKDHFILTFYQILQQPILGTEEERIEQLKNIKQLNAKCIARIIVTPQKIEDITRVLSENIEKFKKKIES
ncbi:MAG TPA: DUF3467 domain-containing protein [Ignavibacteriaceae bacterium]|jgi:hypothetical protein|nr:DUF3467 domain-containing protein [Ignavibacteriaceae bacterium]